jgi:predicted HicB family RNase H-like nuclease
MKEKLDFRPINVHTYIGNMGDNMETEKKLKRLVIDVEEEIHFLVKASAANKGITIRKWVLRAIMKQIKEEKTFD